MARNRSYRVLIDVIKSEGATIVALEEGTKHARVTYTFDGTTQYRKPLVRGSQLSPRKILNYRADVRRQRNEGKPHDHH